MGNIISKVIDAYTTACRNGFSPKGKPQQQSTQTANPPTANQEADWDNLSGQTPTEPTAAAAAPVVGEGDTPEGLVNQQSTESTEPEDLYPNLEDVQMYEGAAASGILGATGNDESLYKKVLNQTKTTEPAPQPKADDAPPADPPATVPEADSVEPESPPAHNSDEQTPPATTEQATGEAQPADSSDPTGTAEPVADTKPEPAEEKPVFIPNPDFQDSMDSQVFTRPLYRDFSVQEEASFTSKTIAARLRNCVRDGKSINGFPLPAMTFILFEYKGEQLRIDELLEKVPDGALEWYKNIPHEVYQVVGVLPDGNIRFVEAEDKENKEFARNYKNWFWRVVKSFIDDSRSGAKLNPVAFVDKEAIINSVRSSDESTNAADATATRYVGPSNPPTHGSKKKPASDIFGFKAGKGFF